MVITLMLLALTGIATSVPHDHNSTIKMTSESAFGGSLPTEGRAI